MTLRHYMATAWSQLTFAARLLAISATALLVAGAAMLLVSTQQSAREAGFDLANELTQELETLPAALAETVVIGDYASLQQQLDRYVVRAGVVSVQFVDSSGQSLQSKDKSPAAIAPDWFLKALQFSDVSGSTAIRVGGAQLWLHPHCPERTGSCQPRLAAADRSVADLVAGSWA